MREQIEATIVKMSPEGRTALLVSIISRIHEKNDSEYDEILTPAGLEIEQVKKRGVLDLQKFRAMYEEMAKAEGWKLDADDRHDDCIVAIPTESSRLKEGEILNLLLRKASTSKMHMLAVYLLGQNERDDRPIAWPSELQEPEALIRLEVWENTRH